ncbi:arsenate reductase ArsC [Asaccharospora irregularis]|uniref:Arsenate reductase n=1 Tax=Asaccharospora irregularis DSM 2635 TaxID=1121321 RepID=A0A1M5SCS5_9FIRM|nr:MULTISPECIES: arsenate reductase ArsC [Peptostreptococcaceae]SHH36334.1 arsenate reductase [Asaccharospora irregularis DSM 2635]
MNKPTVAFICVHNSCRSQMAEAIAKIHAKDIFIPYSGGTEIKSGINQDAVKVIKDIYSIDMNKTQRNKLVSEFPDIDIVITMGCNVNCPWLPCKYREDWGLDDPTGKPIEEFYKTVDNIKEKIIDLSSRIKDNRLNIDI